MSLTLPCTNTKLRRHALLDVSALDDANDRSAVFIVNRSLTESITIDLNWQDRAPKSDHQHLSSCGE